MAEKRAQIVRASSRRENGSGPGIGTVVATAAGITVVATVTSRATNAACDKVSNWHRDVEKKHIDAVNRAPCGATVTLTEAELPEPKK